VRPAHALALLVSLLACQRRPVPAAPPAPAGLAPSLPDIAGFTAEPAVSTNGAELRTYARGATRVTVTLARFPMDAEQYETWVRTSVSGFPQAQLDLPKSAANGFYQCETPERVPTLSRDGAPAAEPPAPRRDQRDDRVPPSCSLLVQLRSGFHLELRGGPAGRADLDAVARGLPLHALAR
jgi:hypothetical protein